MSRNLTKQLYIKKDFYSVYILLNKNNKTFFIGYSLTSNLRNTYRKHYSENINKTKSWITEMKSKKSRPCFFVLDDFNDSKANVFSYMVVLFKVLLENYFLPINKGSLLEYIDDIKENNLDYYEKKKKLDFNEFFDCQNCQFPKYKNEFCENFSIKKNDKVNYKLTNENKKKKIETRVTKDEYELILRKAKNKNQSISNYIKMIALYGNPINFNYEFLDKYVERCDDLLKNINRLIITIISVGKYFPSDLENIQTQMQELIELQRHILKQMRKDKKYMLEHLLKENKKGDNNDC